MQSKPWLSKELLVSLSIITAQEGWNLQPDFVDLGRADSGAGGFARFIGVHCGFLARLMGGGCRFGTAEAEHGFE